MRFALALTGLALSVAPGRAAEDLTPMLPDRTGAVVRVDLKGIVASPFGKNVIGADKPFTAILKLIRVFGGLDAPNVRAADYPKFEALVNKTDRLTVALVGETDVPSEVVLDLLGLGPPKFGPKAETGRLVFVEGAGTADDHAAALEELVGVKPQANEFGGRKTLTVAPAGRFAPALYGLALTDTLFVWADNPKVLEDALARREGKKKFARNDFLIAAVKKLDAGPSPVWLAHGREFRGIGTAALDLGADLELSYTYRGENGLGAHIRDQIEQGLGRGAFLGEVWFKRSLDWTGSDLTVERKGPVITASVVLPGRRVAEDYARQK